MKKLTIRLPDDMSDALARMAQAHHRSVNRHVIWLIEQALKTTPETTPEESMKRGVLSDEPRSDG